MILIYQSDTFKSFGPVDKFYRFYTLEELNRRFPTRAGQISDSKKKMAFLQIMKATLTDGVIFADNFAEIEDSSPGKRKAEDMPIVTHDNTADGSKTKKTVDKARQSTKQKQALKKILEAEDQKHVDADENVGLDLSEGLLRRSNRQHSIAAVTPVTPVTPVTQLIPTKSTKKPKKPTKAQLKAAALSAAKVGNQSGKSAKSSAVEEPVLSESEEENSTSQLDMLVMEARHKKVIDKLTKDFQKKQAQAVAEALAAQASQQQQHQQQQQRQQQQQQIGSGTPFTPVSRRGKIQEIICLYILLNNKIFEFIRRSSSSS